MATFHTINCEVLRLVYRVAADPAPATLAELEALIRHSFLSPTQATSVRTINDRKKIARRRMQAAGDESRRAYWKGRYDAHLEDRNLVENGGSVIPEVAS